MSLSHPKSLKVPELSFPYNFSSRTQKWQFIRKYFGASGDFGPLWEILRIFLEFQSEILWFLTDQIYIIIFSFFWIRLAEISAAQPFHAKIERLNFVKFRWREQFDFSENDWMFPHAQWLCNSIVSAWSLFCSCYVKTCPSVEGMYNRCWKFHPVDWMPGSRKILIMVAHKTFGKHLHNPAVLCYLVTSCIILHLTISAGVLKQQLP